MERRACVLANGRVSLDAGPEYLIGPSDERGWVAVQAIQPVPRAFARELHGALNKRPRLDPFRMSRSFVFVY